jgi:streptomycin 6-kinase
VSDSCRREHGDVNERGGELSIDIPEWLLWLGAEEGGREWLERLPQLVNECADRWKLRLGPPYRGEVSYVAPATIASGSDVVVKINFPSHESEHESAALRHWGGKGAVRLLDDDVARRALLLERCSPGNTLWEARERVTTDVMGDVLTRLWETPAPAGPFRTLVDAAGIWSKHLRAAYERAGAPFEMSLLDDAVEFMATARSTDSSDVVLHQDLHGGNVLRRGGDWVAIDPKPLVGERAFDLASYVRDRRGQLRDDRASEVVVRDRIEHLCSVLHVDRDRTKGWALAHALAWSFDAQTNFYLDHVLAARLIARC